MGFDLQSFDAAVVTNGTFGPAVLPDDFGSLAICISSLLMLSTAKDCLLVVSLSSEMLEL